MKHIYLNNKDVIKEEEQNKDLASINYSNVNESTRIGTISAMKTPLDKVLDSSFQQRTQGKSTEVWPNEVDQESYLLSSPLGHNPLYLSGGHNSRMALEKLLSNTQVLMNEGKPTCFKLGKMMQQQQKMMEQIRLKSLRKKQMFDEQYRKLNFVRYQQKQEAFLQKEQTIQDWSLEYIERLGGARA